MRNTYIRIKFQSLFYWKYHFNVALVLKDLREALLVSILVLLEVPLQLHANPHGYNIGRVVSILVLLEVPLQLIFSEYDISKAFWFQSLFYWKYHFNKD